MLYYILILRGLTSGEPKLCIVTKEWRPFVRAVGPTSLSCAWFLRCLIGCRRGTGVLPYRSWTIRLLKKMSWSNGIVIGYVIFVVTERHLFGWCICGCLKHSELSDGIVSAYNDKWCDAELFVPFVCTVCELRCVRWREAGRILYWTSFSQKAIIYFLNCDGVIECTIVVCCVIIRCTVYTPLGAVTFITAHYL